MSEPRKAKTIILIFCLFVAFACYLLAQSSGGHGSGGSGPCATANSLAKFTTTTTTGCSAVTEAAGVVTVSNPGVNGQMCLNGGTSGSACRTAPAVAGTSTNPVTETNVLAGPDGSGTNPTYGFSSTANVGMFQFGGILGIKGTTLNFYNASNTNFIQFPGATGHLIFNNTKGQHINTQAANNDLFGTASGTTTTATVTFTTNYTSTPSCVITPTTSGVTSAIITSQANSGFTITYAPSGTTNFNYMCGGNPN